MASGLKAAAPASLSHHGPTYRTSAVALGAAHLEAEDTINLVSRDIQSRKFRHALAFPCCSHSAGLGRAKSGAKSEGRRVQY